MSILKLLHLKSVKLNYTLLFLGLFLSLVVSGQVSNGQLESLPFKWNIELGEQSGDEVEIKYVCEVDSSWHIYSFDHKGESGAPVSIVNNYSVDYSTVGAIKEPEPKKSYDDLFEEDVLYHEGTVVFKQTIKRKFSEAFIVNANITTVACQSGGSCTKGDSKLSLEIPSSAAGTGSTSYIFIAGLLAGFLALLTPCVFPLIPLTVSFFTKQAESKGGGIMKAVIYGLSIIVLYVALGWGVTALLGPEVLYHMASSITFNLIFFVILILFAISFLGYFEITIPSAFVNKVDAKADKGGWIGIFFMAFALALVSFSCTGPLIGTLIVESFSSSGVKGPLMGMLGFGIALALPFTLFAIFPSWLKALPKSGSWLNSVKVVLGLAEFGLALKFLSNVDLVLQSYILPREFFILIWVVIALLIAIYLMGWIRFKHDSKLQNRSITRGLISVSFFSIAIFLSASFIGKNDLKFLSGVLPQPEYSWNAWFSGDRELHCPNGLDCYHYYSEALEVSKKENKPLFVDFTGFTCANCRHMEQSVWSEPEIDSLLRNEFIVVSLYVDQVENLPDSLDLKELISGETSGLKTYGDLWGAMEIERYGKLTQPLYVQLDNSEQLLVPTRSYNTDVQAFKAFLEKGLKAYKARNDN